MIDKTAKAIGAQIEKTKTTLARVANALQFELVWPKITLPKIKAPIITLPTITMPKISWPRLHMPKIALPQMKRPKISMPRLHINLPRLRLPKLQTPKLNMPSIRISQISPPQIQWPRLKAPKVKFPAISFVTIAQTLSIRRPSTIGAIIGLIVSLNMLLVVLYFAQHTSIAKETGTTTLIEANRTIIASEPTIDEILDIEPASGEETQEEEPQKYAYKIEEDTLEVEAVLVPHKVTVISSSRDGRIAEIPVQNGDLFKKGDVLLRYDCGDLKAESEIAAADLALSKERAEGSYKLFKLDLISSLEKQGFATEEKKAEAREKLYQARLEHCTIRAEFDGRVTNRLANQGEYTRTDRVLLEIASLDPLKAEFLLPSRWLRWINVGAPLELTVSETERTYSAEISRLYGEIDPVSQSIQIVATLDDYQDLLLPGMSGTATLSASKIRAAGISGLLEQKTAAK